MVQRQKGKIMGEIVRAKCSVMAEKEKIHLPYLKEMASLNQSQHSASKVNKSRCHKEALLEEGKGHWLDEASG